MPWRRSFAASPCGLEFSETRWAAFFCSTSAISGSAVKRVAERLGREVATGREVAGGGGPGEELVHERAQVRGAKRGALRARHAPAGRVDGVHRADSHQALHARRMPAERRLEKAAAAVREAANQLDPIVGVGRAAARQDVVDRARVGLEQPAEVAEQRHYRFAGVALDVRKQHRVGVDDRGEEVPLPARERFAVLGLGRLDCRPSAFDCVLSSADGPAPYPWHRYCAGHINMPRETPFGSEQP